MMMTERQKTALNVVNGWAGQLAQAAKELSDVVQMLREEFGETPAPTPVTGAPKILNSEGENIGPTIVDAAAASGIEGWHLAALLKAESGLNPKAERWGGRTSQAKQIIAVGNTDELQALIDDVWPDISFGMSQRIVLYHDQGDRTQSFANCLAVRAYVFNNPADDIQAAARRLAGCFQHPTCDGTALSAMVVYNAGSDRRSDPEWFNVWGANVAAYQRALEWAEQFK